MAHRFQYGDEIVLRNYHPNLGTERGSIARVVEDSADRTVTYVSAGSEYKQVVWMGNAPPKPDQVGKFETKVWRNFSVLRIMYPGVPYSIWAMWRADDGSFVRWYVNIELPFERAQHGFDVIDYELDIVVSPDWTWEWKDEDALARLVEVGVFTRKQSTDFRKFGMDAIRRVEARSAPFDEPWPAWQPDPSWGPLKMPADEGWLA